MLLVLRVLTLMVVQAAQEKTTAAFLARVWAIRVISQAVAVVLAAAMAVLEVSAVAEMALSVPHILRAMLGLPIPAGAVAVGPQEILAPAVQAATAARASS